MSSAVGALPGSTGIASGGPMSVARGSLVSGTFASFSLWMQGRRYACGARPRIGRMVQPRWPIGPNVRAVTLL
jgi:hypothetical protein